MSINVRALPLLILASLPLVAADGAAGQRFAVPPGQEPLVTSMLAPPSDGAPWPCALDRIQAGPSHVLAEYRCPAADRSVRLVLAHPSTAAAPVLARTERFVIRAAQGSPGAPPPELASLIVAQVRSHEAAFRWQAVGAPRSGTSLPPPGAADEFSPAVLDYLRSPRAFALSVLAGALLIFFVDLLLRRRRRARS